MKKVREFNLKIDGEEVALFFKQPSQGELRQMDMVYGKYFSEACREGMLTRAAALDLYNKDGSWTKEHEKEAIEIGSKVANLEKILKDSNPEKDHDSNMEIIRSVNSLRFQLNVLYGRRTDLLQNTCESYASMQKMHQFVATCCFKQADSERLFPQMSDYERFVEENPIATAQLIRMAYAYDYNLSDDPEEDYETVKYLRANKDLIEKKEALKSKKTAKKPKSKKKRKKPVKKEEVKT